MKLAELGSLIPMLSHELRQPLAGVKGYVDLLLHKRTLDEAVRAKLIAVREQVGHMTGLIESLTGYSRVAKARDQLVGIERPLDLALSIFPVLRNRARYELEVQVDADLPPVRGSSNSIQQVLVNLLKNAKDAVDEAGGGRIAVRIWHDRDAEELCVRVADSGPGIPAEARDRLFQPFFTTKQEGVGTGLGLTICRQIMAEHGGTIELDSPAEGRGGAAFTLRFPAVRDAVGGAVRDAALAAP
jgi:two-component system NtrC family sensor kinase